MSFLRSAVKVASGVLSAQPIRKGKLIDHVVTVVNASKPDVKEAEIMDAPHTSVSDKRNHFNVNFTDNAGTTKCEHVKAPSGWKGMKKE